MAAQNAFIALLVSLTSVLAFASTATAEEVPFSSDRWSIGAQEHRIEDFEGRETLFLKNGVALLEDVSFLNGILEFELMVGPDRGFSGARWRMQDAGNYEDFYIRPHQSGKPDANQYQPVFNGVAAWQIYFGPEYSVAIDYPFDEWIPVRIEVLGDKAQVFMDGGNEPSLVIDDLLHETVAGAVGISSGWAGARFANFRVTQTDNISIAAQPEFESKPPAKGLIEEWQVSDAVPESILVGVTQLDTGLLDGLKWHSLAIESNGIANLARLQTSRTGKNTAFIRLRLQADAPTVQALEFGFSDRVRVFVNGTLTFSASDMWQSRDYRFLGTVGLHDTVHCSLKRGRNEVILAISDSFGGWAVSGALVPETGVTHIVE